MLSFLKPLERHFEFIGHVMTMMSGRTLAALIAFFTMPIVSRLYVPDDFGVAAAFSSTIGMISTVSSLRYEAAFVLPKNDSEAVRLMALAYRILFFICVGIFLLVAGHHLSGATSPLMELLDGWKWLLPLGVLLMGARNIQESWLIRTRSFKLASVSLLVENVTHSGTRIVSGALFGSTVHGLIGGHLLGITCRFFVQQGPGGRGLQTALSSISWKRLRATAYRYADFPKLNAPAELVFSVGQNLPVLLFGAMFSPAVAGFYAISNRLTRVPFQVVVTSLRYVFLQKVAAIKNRGNSLWKAFLLATAGLALTGTPPFLVLWLFGQPLLTRFLGEPWFEAGRYVEIMSIWLFFVWITAPCNAIFVVLRQQKLWLGLQTTSTVLKLSAFGLAYVLASEPEATLRLFVSSTVISSSLIIMTTVILIARDTSVSVGDQHRRP